MAASVIRDSWPHCSWRSCCVSFAYFKNRNFEVRSRTGSGRFGWVASVSGTVDVAVGSSAAEGLDEHRIEVNHLSLTLGIGLRSLGEGQTVGLDMTMCLCYLGLKLCFSGTC